MDYTIPKVQKAIIASNTGTKHYEVKVVDNHPVPEINDDEVLVRLTSSGVCHSDLSFLNGSWGLPMNTVVAGHEGSGYIVKLGANVNAKKYPLGLRVGVPIVYGPCKDCDACDLPDGECFCPNTPFVGSGVDGTWQQFIKIKGNYIIPIPGEPNEQEVGPVLCGGVTVYKALKGTGCRAGQWVVITGAGGGLGTMGVQYAVAMGLRVVAIDAGDDKKDECLKLGAEVYVDFKKDNVTKKILDVTNGGAHGAVMVAPYAASLNQAPEFMRLKGTIVVVGLPASGQAFEILPAALVFKGLTVKGSLVGGKHDLAESLDFLARDQMHPPIKVYNMDGIEHVLKAMENGTLMGRAVIDLR